MNPKTLTTSQIMKELIAEMQQMNILDQLNVLCFVIGLWIRRQRLKALNVFLSVVVLAMFIYLVSR